MLILPGGRNEHYDVSYEIKQTVAKEILGKLCCAVLYNIVVNSKDIEI